MAEVSRKRAPESDGAATMRKKLRPSELPLSQAKRSAIDSLVHMFRKKGAYDDIRRDLMKQYVSGPAKDELQAALKELVDRETDRNPSLLSKDPRMATTLIEGAGERSDIYGNIMNTVNTLLDKLIDEHGVPKMREYRIQEIGAEAAADEEQRGSKSEEESWRQSAREREEKAKREERKRREKEEDEARERGRQAEKERRRKEREERDKEDEERRRKDREGLTKKEKKSACASKRSERNTRRVEKPVSRRSAKKTPSESVAYKRSLTEIEVGAIVVAVAVARTPERDRDRRGRDRSRRRSRTRSRSPERRSSIKPENIKDIKVDDDLVLQLLLQESEQMKKSRQRPVLERSESLEPPMRKAQPPKSIVPRDPRLARLDSKPASPSQPSPSKDEDVTMTDAPSAAESAKARWDKPPELPSKRGRSRSRSIARSTRKRSRTRSHSRGSRLDRDRRSSRYEDDRRSRRDDDRHSYRPSRRDDRDDKLSRRDRARPRS
ncbi:unnamed protein product [Alternaria alternata]